MTALSGPAVTVAAITAGICGWLVVDEPVELGRRDLAATDEEPTEGDNVNDLDVWCDIKDRWWFGLTTCAPDYPVPVGRVAVAVTVTVTHCLPIRDGKSLNYQVPTGQRHVAIKQRGRVDLSAYDPTAGVLGRWTHEDITEQTVWQSGGWLPGRWALQVTDPTPVEADA